MMSILTTSLIEPTLQPYGETYCHYPFYFQGGNYSWKKTEYLPKVTSLVTKASSVLYHLHCTFNQYRGSRQQLSKIRLSKIRDRISHKPA